MFSDATPSARNHSKGPLSRRKSKTALRRRKPGSHVVEALEPRQLLSAVAPLRPDHIVVVVEEDRASGALGDPNMPYFNQLAQGGLVYSNSHGLTHPSVPNYLALYSGSTQGVTDNNPNHSFSGPNLAKSLNTAGLSFTGYAESLPSAGSQVQYAPDASVDPDKHPDIYFRAYNPMAQFTDAGPGKTNADVNKPFMRLSDELREPAKRVIHYSRHAAQHARLQRSAVHRQQLRL